LLLWLNWGRKLASQKLTTMNTSPQKNWKTKVCIVLEAAGHHSSRDGFQWKVCCLSKFDRNLRSKFLDSSVYAKQDYHIGQWLANVAKMNDRFAV
jgi:hypothetical protein